MLGAQGVPRSTNTKAETTTPLAAIATSTIDWSKRPHSSIRRISSSLTLAILGQKTFSCIRPTLCRCHSRFCSDPLNLATSVLEKRSQAHFAPGKRRCRMLDAPVYHLVERQHQTLGFSVYMSGSSFLARRLSR